jgi:hypothetical protein
MRFRKTVWRVVSIPGRVVDHQQFDGAKLYQSQVVEVLRIVRKNAEPSLGVH